MSDPAKYRTKEEVKEVREQHDPINGLKSHILEGGHASEDEIKDIEVAIKAEVGEAAEFAKNSPEPDPSELYTDVLIEE